MTTASLTLALDDEKNTDYREEQKALVDVRDSFKKTIVVKDVIKS